MEITYRRTVQVREYESITIEVKETTDDFEGTVSTLEGMVDAELESQKQRLLDQYRLAEFADDEDLS